MTTPKAVPTAQTNVELIKVHNQQCSLIAEAMLGFAAVALPFKQLGRFIRH